MIVDLVIATPFQNDSYYIFGTWVTAIFLTLPIAYISSMLIEKPFNTVWKILIEDLFVKKFLVSKEEKKVNMDKIISYVENDSQKNMVSEPLEKNQVLCNTKINDISQQTIKNQVSVSAKSEIDEIKYLKLSRMSMASGTTRKSNRIVDRNTPLVKSIVSLICCATGVAWLYLPQSWSEFGLISGIVMIGIATANTIITVKLLSLCMGKYVQFETYGEIANADLGRVAGSIINWTYLFNIFIIQITFNSVINLQLISLVYAPLASWLDITDHGSFKTIVSGCCFLAVTLWTMPMQMQTNVKLFESLGYVTVCACIFVATLLCIDYSDYSSYNDPDIKMDDFSQPLGLLRNIGTFQVALDVVDCIFLVRNQMGKNFSEINMIKVGYTTTLWLAVMFSIIGIMGYLSMGDGVLNIPVILNRPSIPGQSDNMIIIAKLLLIFSASLSIASRAIAVKEQVCQMWNIYLTRKINIIMTLVFMIWAPLISFLYKDFGDFVNLLGSYGMTTMSTAIPCFIAVKIFLERGQKCAAILTICWCVPIGALQYSGAVCTLLKMVGVIHPPT